MRAWLFASLILGMTVGLASQTTTLPAKAGSVRFAVIGDSGTGGDAQYEIGERMAEYHAVFPFPLVLMLGDNMYGRENRPSDFEKKFELPYRDLLDAGVTFRASLGNHDEPTQRFYPLFNMDGHLYYSFTSANRQVRFFALNSVTMDEVQIAWLEEALRASAEPWKIAFFHHPLYSSGLRHGSNEELRRQLEPLFIAHGVDAVFAGHEHFYERIRPQHGIAYFTSGGAARLRWGNILRGTPLTDKGFDQDNHFMLIEIASDELHFQVVSRAGETVDSGVISKQDTATGESRAANGGDEHSMEVVGRDLWRGAAQALESLRLDRRHTFLDLQPSFDQ